LARRLDARHGYPQQPGGFNGQGKAVTLITQKAVEILGPLGYSRKVLVEKWMRDAKINDIFEGTQQINLMIIARRILDYSSKELN
jgi:acyl-CoA dehydrogenase